MTAIWDRIGGVAHTLYEQSEQEFDEDKAVKLKDALSAVYNSIKNSSEYQNLTIWFPDKKPNMLQGCQQILNEEKWTPIICGVVSKIIETLHDFDHRDLPLGRKKTYGHYTEGVIRKRENKEYAKVLKNIHYDDWWNTSQINQSVKN